MQRTGKVGQPSFRVVLQEHTDAVKGEAKEVLGNYNPTLEGKPFSADLERIKFWLSKGVRVSDSLAVLLKNQGIEGMEKFIEPRDKKKKKKGEQPEAPVAATPAPAPAPETPAVETAPAPAPETPAPEPTPEAAPEATPTPEAPVETTPAPEAPAPEATPIEPPAEAPKDEPKEEPKQES